MEITVNGENKIIDNESLLLLINNLLGEKTNGIAIAVNEQIIPKSNWQNASLKENDCVLIINATQGG